MRFCVALCLVFLAGIEAKPFLPPYMVLPGAAVPLSRGQDPGPMIDNVHYISEDGKTMVMSDPATNSIMMTSSSDPASNSIMMTSSSDGMPGQASFWPIAMPDFSNMMAHQMNLFENNRWIVQNMGLTMAQQFKNFFNPFFAWFGF